MKKSQGSFICTTIKSAILWPVFPTDRWDSFTMGSGYATGRTSATCWSLHTGIWPPVSTRTTRHFHWNTSSRNTRPLAQGICGTRLMESEEKTEAESAALYTKNTPYKGGNRSCRACQPPMRNRMRRRVPWSCTWRTLWPAWSWCFSTQSMRSCLCWPAAPGLSAVDRRQSAWNGP